jgi:flagellar biosynthesis/type III secretory pathway chaperone
VPPAPEATYANHLVHEAQAVEAFIEILHQEQTALGQSPASFEHLMRHTEAKTQQAELISRLESSRKTLADACREAKSSSETDTELAQRLNCGELWARLSARVAEARIQNNINGLAIQNRLERTNSTLAFLRNQTSGSLYAANGRRQTVESGRLRAGA